MKRILLAIALILCLAGLVWSQASRAIYTYSMAPGQQAVCVGDMLLSPRGDVAMATCQPPPVPSAAQIESRLEQPLAVVGDIPIVVTLAWDPPTVTSDGQPFDPELLSHYTIYVCDSPILAGGPEQDDTQVKAASCESGNLASIDLKQTSEEIPYNVDVTDSTIYYRGSAVTVHGQEAKLSDPQMKDLTFVRPGKITLRIVK